MPDDGSFVDPPVAAPMVQPVGTVRGIIETTAAAFGVSSQDLLSTRRVAALVSARHAAMWLARKRTGHGYLRLGNAFRRDHSTVMYGVLRATERLQCDPAFAGKVERLEAMIEQGHTP